MIISVKTILFIFTLSYGSGSNVTVEYKLDDKCSNECDVSDSSNWCGKRKRDSEGFISRCQQYTRYGNPCESSCHVQTNNENWCMTNVRTSKQCEYWEYCSLEGFTINREKCWDYCAMRGEKYYWCHTNENKWDYCSPPGIVKPVQLTTEGRWCKSECAHHNEDYYWCDRSWAYCNSGGRGGKSMDSTWSYCSIDDMHTRYGKICKNKCSKSGEDYYWCYTLDGSWDYCSPKAEDGVHLSLEIEMDIYGKECRSICDPYGENYFWCRQIGGRSGNWWDYCSPQKKTRYNVACYDQCKRRGEAYFWCHTQNSWDYCSPDHLYSGAERKSWQIYLIILSLWSMKLT